MRIISDFKDYYDCIQKTHYDPSVQYIRKAFNVPFDIHAMPMLRGNLQYSETRIDQRIIGFCKKIYPSIKLSFWEGTKVKELIDHDPERLIRFCEDNLRPTDFRRYRVNRNINAFFEQCEREKDKFAHLFEKHESPIFITHYKNYPIYESFLQFNCALEPFGFYRRFPPYQAFQEIFMFMNNLAEPRKKIPQLDDVTMAESKGFDKKWSFRRRPQRN